MAERDRPAPLTAPLTGAPLPDPDDDIPEPPRLRTLRRLVTALTVTLILGVITIAGALVVRISGGTAPAVPLNAALIEAEALSLPAGERITATGGSGGTLVLLGQAADGAERLHLIDGATGAILRSIPVRRVPD